MSITAVVVSEISKHDHDFVIIARPTVTLTFTVQSWAVVRLAVESIKYSMNSGNVGVAEFSVLLTGRYLAMIARCRSLKYAMNGRGSLRWTLSRYAESNLREGNMAL